MKNTDWYEDSLRCFCYVDLDHVYMQCTSVIGVYELSPHFAPWMSFIALKRRERGVKTIPLYFDEIKYRQINWAQYINLLNYNVLVVIVVLAKEKLST